MAGRIDHLGLAKGIMARDPNDVGDHEVAEATAHAILAAVDQLAAITAVLQSREPGIRVRNTAIQESPRR